jgi:hypothetical protein
MSTVEPAVSTLEPAVNTLEPLIMADALPNDLDLLKKAQEAKDTISIHLKGSDAEKSIREALAGLDKIKEDAKKDREVRRPPAKSALHAVPAVIPETRRVIADPEEPEEPDSHEARLAEIEAGEQKASEAKTDDLENVPDDAPAPVISPEDISAIKHYWANVVSRWELVILPLIERDIRANTRTSIEFLLESLPENIRDHVDFQIFFNEINQQRFDSHLGHQQLYISAKMRIENIPYVEALYDHRPQGKIAELTITKYQAFSPTQQVVGTLRFAGLETVVKLSHLTYIPKWGYNKETKLSVVSFIVLVDPEVAPLILEKRSAQAKSAQGVLTAAEVWVPSKYDATNTFLHSIIGEPHFLHHVGNISFVTKADEIYSPDDVFLPITKIRDDLALVEKAHQYTYCAYCKHSSLQLAIKNCPCHLVAYCGKKCQLAGRPQHKAYCKTALAQKR